MQPFPTIVRGIVIPIKWDDEGKALSAVIMSTDEKVYRIEDDEKARDLLNLLQQEITVTGSVRKTHKGSYLIKIADYISRNRFVG